MGLVRVFDIHTKHIKPVTKYILTTLTDTYTKFQECVGIMCVCMCVCLPACVSSVNPDPKNVCAQARITLFFCGFGHAYGGDARRVYGIYYISSSSSCTCVRSLYTLNTLKGTRGIKSEISGPRKSGCGVRCPSYRRALFINAKCQAPAAMCVIMAAHRRIGEHAPSHQYKLKCRMRVVLCCVLCVFIANVK